MPLTHARVSRLLVENIFYIIIPLRPFQSPEMGSWRGHRSSTSVTNGGHWRHHTLVIEYHA